MKIAHKYMMAVAAALLCLAGYFAAQPALLATRNINITPELFAECDVYYQRRSVDGIPPSINDLTHSSDAIVHGIVSDVSVRETSSFTSSDERFRATLEYATVVVQNQYKGTPQKEITLIQPGNGIPVRKEDAHIISRGSTRSFASGQELIVFLKAKRDQFGKDGIVYVVLHRAGQYEIIEGKLCIDYAAQPIGYTPPIDLADLVSRINYGDPPSAFAPSEERVIDGAVLPAISPPTAIPYKSDPAIPTIDPVRGVPEPIPGSTSTPEQPPPDLPSYPYPDITPTVLRP